MPSPGTVKLREGSLTPVLDTECNGLLQMCSTLGEYSTLCRTVADQKLPLVLDIAAAELSPGLVCPYLYPGCGAGHTHRRRKVDTY